MSAAHPHTFLGHTKSGQSAIFVTTGNPDCHVILRGGRKSVNYDSASVAQVTAQLQQAGLQSRVMIDCSHANSNKDYKRQGAVCRDVAAQVRSGNRDILGVMLEGNLIAGAQKLEGGSKLIYGQSITDACIGWDETYQLLSELAYAIREGRSTIAGMTRFLPLGMRWE